MTTKTRKPLIIVTAADLAPEAVALLQDYEVIYAGKAPTEEDIVTLCKQHDPAAVIARYGRVGAAAIAAAPSLRVISRHGAGVDTIDLVAARARGVEVRAATGANAAAVAEHATALMLACAKSVPELNERMHRGYWDKATYKSLELGGRTVGLVGLGAIGVRFARICKAMEMQVIGFDPFAKHIPDFIETVDLPTLWGLSDVISLHCPLTDDNRNLLNAKALSQCKPGVIIVNTARGGLVEESSLLEAVRSGQVRAAGLDSFASEPMMPGHPFHGESRIILSPHIGGVSGDTYVKLGVTAVRNARSVIEGVAPSAVD